MGNRFEFELEIRYTDKEGNTKRLCWEEYKAVKQ